MVMMDRLYAHNDEIFKLDKPSGIDGVPLYGIDDSRVEERHTLEIRANVQRSQAHQLKEMGL